MAKVTFLSVAHNLQNLLKSTFIDDGLIQKSLDNIITLARELADRDIELLELQMSAEDSTIKGSCIISKDKYKILVLAGLNECWTRFVTCKEIMHALIDCDEYHNIDIDDHLEKVYYRPPDVALSAVSEFMAEAAAMEVMFPFNDRVAISEQKNIDFFEIATRYKIPKVYIQKYLSNTYMDFFKQFK